MPLAGDEMSSLVGIVNVSLGDEGYENTTGDDELLGGDHETEDPVRTVKLIISVIFTLVFVVGVLGNILVIVAATGRLRGLQKSMSVFILNLSVADLLYLIMCLPFQATVITVPSWIFGGFMCKMVQFLTYASMCASIFTLVAMSMDRYFAVAHPLKFFGVRTLRNSVLIIALIWVMAVGCSAPFLHVRVIHQEVNKDGVELSYCVEGGWEDPWRQRRQYYAFLFTACYMVPLFLMSISYALILRTLWRTFKSSSDDADSSSNKAKKKVTLIVSVVVLAFGICWLPHHILYMWLNFGDFPYTNGTLALKMIAVTLSTLNSSLNPIIYSIMSENFRQALKRCLRRCTSSRERTKVVPHHYRMKLLRSKRPFQV